MSAADGEARRRALTDLGATLLVEAAAGTGKTALMAGRLTIMLAEGCYPRHIAAITFGDLAASEIASRAHRYIDELLAGRIPDPLLVALPDGLSEAQRGRLAAAKGALDGLTASTIHGFSQDLIRQYAAEADIDPGAEIIDADASDAAFAGIFDRWLRRRLSAPVPASDPIAVLSRSDPRQVVPTLRELAKFRRKHPSARPPAADFSARPDILFSEAVAAFANWAERHPREEGIAAAIEDFETLARHFSDALDTVPPFDRLWALTHPPRFARMRKDSFDLKPPKLRGAWKRIAGKDQGARLADEAERLFARADEAYRTLMGTVATAIVAVLTDEIDEVLRDYAAFKRAAAVLDFDDLLIRAADMLRRHESVRRALSDRYRFILVDEFQDTDPLQAEIVFRLASQENALRWQEGELRPGALFLVGDPKQAIYQFRGANAGSYGQAKAVIEGQFPGNVIRVTANFRSRPGILAHVNRHFDGPLSAAGQPGYVPLSHTVKDDQGAPPAVARLAMDLPHGAGADHIREAEADAVAQACTLLIGNLTVRGEDGRQERLRPGGIALLAPAGRNLWYYERALEERGLPVASQAGKGLFRRQEVQDLIALARALADASDTLAFGALMRGPLVGLTEEELLDITQALTDGAGEANGADYFTVRTDPDSVSHLAAKRALSILRDLRRKAPTTTPALLLAEAVERLGVRPILALRARDRSARAAANVDLFLERARPYAVKGLRQFARDIAREWSEGVAAGEGRVDVVGDAIELVTIHSAKGLEWPVVIPVNAVTQFRPPDPFVHRAVDDTVHWLVGDVVPPSLGLALQADEQDAARERQRLWYVACTRARDLLVVPQIAGANQRSWARVLDLGIRTLPPLDLSGWSPAALATEADPPNEQTQSVFAAERAEIDRLAVPMRWIQPSKADSDRLPVDELLAAEMADQPETDLPVGAGRVRGLVLHKLMEEILTGETLDDVDALTARAHSLMAELPVESHARSALPDPQEMAGTVRRTLGLPEIAAIRAALVPELPLTAMLDSDPPVALAGRADAIELAGGWAETVVDWKSDAAPVEADMRAHAEQVREYAAATGASRGLIVYMTPGIVRTVTTE